MSGLIPPDQKAMEEDWEGLSLGAPEGAVGWVAVGGGGRRGCAGVLGEYEGRLQDGYQGDRAAGAGGQEPECDDGGKACPRLYFSFLSFIMRIRDEG